MTARETQPKPKLTKAQLALLKRADSNFEGGVHLAGSGSVVASALERKGLLEGRRFAAGYRFITPAGREAFDRAINQENAQ